MKNKILIVLGIACICAIVCFPRNAEAESYAVTSFTPGNDRANYSDYVGFKFTVGGSDIWVTKLGRYVFATHNQTHNIKITADGDATALADCDVDISASVVDTFEYCTLPTPYKLLAGTTYHIFSLEYAGGDNWGDTNAVITAPLAPEIASYDDSSYILTGAVFSGSGLAFHTYGPPNFAYETYDPTRRTLVRPPNNLGLLAYYSLNEGSGTVVTDFSGNGRTGTFINSPTWTAGKRSKALGFNGSTQGVHLAGSVGNFSIPSGGAMTVSAWVKTLDESGAVVSFRNGLSASPIFDLSIGYNGLTTNAGHFLPLMNYDAGNGLVEVVSTKRIDDGQWHHVVAVVDQSGDVFAAYVDGVLYSTAQNTDGVLTFGNDEISIGVEKQWSGNAYGTNDEQYLEGTIDEVRVYNRALTAAEVRGLYGTGSVVIGGVEKSKVTTGLVSHWTFNGSDVIWSSATAGTAYDRFGGQNGTLTGMSQSISPVRGKIGQALGFDGTDDYVSIADHSSLNVSNVTVSAWIKTTQTGGYIIAKDPPSGE